MESLIFENVDVVFNQMRMNECTLKTSEENSIKTLQFISKFCELESFFVSFFFKENQEEILTLDLKLPMRMEIINSHNLFAIIVNDVNFVFKCPIDLHKCANWLEDKKESKSKAPEEKLIIQLIIDSFEKINTVQNEKFKINPEDYIFSKIEECWRRISKFYGFYTTLCQSSGFGKSRACQNLSEKAYVVYCCLRSPKSESGYPKRSFIADELVQEFLNEYSARNCYIRFFNMFFHFLNQNQTISYKEFYKKFSNNFDDRTPYNRYDIIDEIKKIQEKCPKTDTLINYKVEKPLIFVFDSASSLLKSGYKIKSNYFIIRNVISEFNQDNKIFVLFVDTFSCINNYLPNKMIDLSIKLNQPTLIEPIYLLPNWDVFVKIDGINTPSDSMLFDNICSFGRPLWGAWCKAKKSDTKYNQISFKELVSLAKQKLVGGGIKELFELTTNDILAILSCRIGTIKPLLYSTAQELVAMNMAVCTYANYEEHLFEIEYPSEPFLANAATFYFHDKRILYNKTQSGLYLMINKFEEAICSSIVDHGGKIETVTKLLLLNAYDVSVDQLYLRNIEDCIIRYCSYVKVEFFLLNLYGPTGLNVIKQQFEPHESEKLLNGYVRFNHFVRTKCSKEKLNLKNLMKRCCAIQCLPEEDSVDFVIPVIFSLDENSFDKMSMILVQTKLHASTIDINKLKHYELCINDIEPPFLVINMQLNKFRNAFILQENITKLKNRAVIYSEGISSKVFCSIDSDTSNGFENFLNSQNYSYLTGLDRKISEEITFSTDNKLKL